MTNLLEHDEKDFCGIVERLKNMQRFSEGCLQINFNELKQKSLGLYYETLTNFYRGFAFFPDEEIMTKLKTSGLLEKDLCYFTQLSEILNELNKIWSDKNIFSMKKLAIESLVNHYHIKISAAIMRRLGFTTSLNGKEDTIQLKRNLYNIKRRRKDEINNDRQGSFKSFRNPIDEYFYQFLLAMDCKPPFFSYQSKV